jgi:tetraacyldisaccharide 4'-kinase
LLSLLYSQLARARRRYYDRRPHLRRRLTAPVISVGNLTVGGSGKTPLAAQIARLLLEMGERPSILSRGYARKIPVDGVVVVSDGARVLEPVERSGDEPQMLAHAVPHAAVLVSSSRYAAGRLAESRLGCTVHILDDGFQHFDLMRDIDLLVAPDASDTRTLPFGRLREPLDAASAADALLVEAPGLGPPSPPASADKQDPAYVRSGDSPTFTFSRRLGGPPPDRPAFAFAGIAKPERFFGDLERAGWRLTGRRSFRDHHHYSTAQIEEITRAARSSGAEVILTTEKDFVRLGFEEKGVGRVFPVHGSKNPPDPFFPITAVPLEVTLEPGFAPWLRERLRAVREANVA